MCEEACINCQQCEEYKNGCHGQIGSFNDEMCPTPIIDEQRIVS
ncbi:hypothetical protein [Phosphitispora fastidiosa]|nr:hypothetical protein [Phosphitispora fastidiosa]MBU7007102.1 hypothetical protein [Phosphitispora fastidiosa]